MMKPQFLKNSPKVKRNCIFYDEKENYSKEVQRRKKRPLDISDVP